jgi:Peptidase family C25
MRRRDVSRTARAKSLKEGAGLPNGGGRRAMAMALMTLLWVGAAAISARGAVFSGTSTTNRLAPGERVIGLSLPRFNPADHPDAPVLLQVEVNLQAVFSAGITFYGTQTGGNPVSYSLGNAVVVATANGSGALVPSRLSLKLSGTNLVGAGGIVPISPVVSGMQAAVASDAAMLALYQGIGSVAYDVDFIAAYPPLVSTIPAAVAGLVHDDAVSVILTVQYTSAPVIAVSGVTNYSYTGLPQGPSTVTVYGPTSPPQLSYSGANGTVYGPSATAPKAAGVYTVVATVASDPGHAGATSAPLAFQIQPVPLSVVASPQSKVYGITWVLGAGSTAFSTFGLVHGEKLGTVTLTASGGLAASSPVANYIVNPSAATGGSFSPGNYVITYLPSILFVTPAPSSVTVTGATQYVYTGTPLGPTTVSKSGSSGAVTFQYAGTNGTVYASSAVRPSSPGSYLAVASLAGDANYSSAVSSPFLFSITPPSPPDSDVPLLPPWGMAALIASVLALGFRRARSIAPLAGWLFGLWMIPALAIEGPVALSRDPLVPEFAPLAFRQVQLRSFEARPSDQGTHICWRTGMEWGVIGFDLDRAGGGQWIRVNSGLIVAGDRRTGGKYEAVDPTASMTGPVVYRLTARLRSGASEELARRVPDPVPAIPASNPEVVPAAPVRKISLEGSKTVVPAVVVPVNLPNSTAGVKILTTAVGMHFVSAATLATVLGQTDATVVAGWITNGTVALFNGGFDSGHQVTYIPGNGFTSGGTTPGLFFYAQQIWNNYTTTNAYWLRAGTNIYSTLDMGSPSAVTPGNYAAVSSAQQDIDNGLSVILQYPGTPQGSDTDQSFWFWKQMTAASANDTWSTTFALDRLVSGASDTAQLTLQLFGGTTTSQMITVSLNGTVIDGYAPSGSLRWSGIGPRQIQFTFPMTLLKDNAASPSQGKNSLTAQALLPSGAAVCQFYLDSYQLSYRRKYAIASTLFPALEASSAESAGQTITVSGFGGSTRPTILGFDVSDVLRPKKVTGLTVAGTAAAWTASLKPTASTTRFVVLNPAVSGAQAVPPASSISLVYPPQLDDPSIRASYLIVTHSTLTNSANALAAYRNSSFRTKVVVMDDIYNQFSFGVATPHALEAFVKTAYSQWAVPPRYLVLVGDGSYDYRDLTASRDFFVPPLMIATPYGAFASDNRYGKVGPDGLPRVIVGRFPVSTDAEFTIMLNKIKSYESKNTPSLKALLLADQPDAAGDFIANRNAVRNYLAPRYTSTSLDPGYSPPVNATIAAGIQTGIKNALNSGMDLFNYMGHGAQDQLGIQPYAQVDSQSPVSFMPVLSNAGRLPVLVAMTCVAGDFAEPGFTSIGEALLRVNSTGAVAVVAPTGLSQDSDATVMNATLANLLGVNARGRLGDLVAQAFSQYNVAPPPNASTSFWIYNILGDPALRVTSPGP